MFSLLVLSLFLSVAYGSLISPRLVHQTIEDPNPKRCCLPDHWQGYINEIIYIKAANINQEVIYEYAVKTPEKFAAFKIVEKFTRKVLSRGVIDYNTNVFYNISGTTCVKSPRPAVFEEPLHCMPKDAEHLGDYFVGGTADGWRASYWIAHNVTKRMKYLEISLSHDNCLPIAESIIFDAGADLKITANFVNIESRITDPTIFDVPAGCKNSVPKEIMGAELRHPRKDYV